MEKDLKNVPSFDEIVFENRNKEYGAYSIRKKYNRTVMWAMLVGIIILGSAIITPYVMASVNERRHQKEEKAVTAEMEQLDQPNQEIAPPPPPPPPAETQTVVKYVAPIIVDSVKVDDKSALATVDEVSESTTDEAVVEVVEEVKEEVQEVKEEEVFLVVEEMPSFGSGDANEFRAWVAQNMKYPEVAAENGIQGRVFVQFVIEPDGRLSNVRVIRGVDPALDKEAVRVIESSPRWNAGKQRGKPVRVSYTFPITFVLQ
ncbi:MAG: energy transducer TonB [Bacteroidales bacterium]|nr:MAG: energy transducer TonB [Bacteroidales bacterium]